MKRFLLYIPLLIFTNCSSSLNSIIKEDNRFYSKEQLKNDFLMQYLRYINNTRDTVFKENGLTRAKNFTLIEYRNMVDWNYYGCLLSNDNIIGFQKEITESLKYEECGLDNYIKYLENTDEKDIEECSKRNWATGESLIFLIESKKGKVTIKKFQDFDIEQCIIEQNMKN